MPEELRRRARWVRYTAAKVPLTPHGKAASVIDPSTWSRFAEVESSTVGRGYGFVLDGDGIVCLDLDGCLSGGELAPWAREILDACPGTYVEVSPSGTGLHVFGFGQVERGRRVRRGGRAVEVYGRGRYIAVTGERFADTPRRLAALPDVGELV